VAKLVPADTSSDDFIGRLEGVVKIVTLSRPSNLQTPGKRFGDPTRHPCSGMGRC